MGCVIAENQQSAGALLDRLLEDVPAIARDVAADLGGEATASGTEPIVAWFLAAVAGAGPRLRASDLARLRAEGAAAARQGLPLATPIDAYLSTAWVTWDHAVRSVPVTDPEALGVLGALLLRAGDDIAAALADGFTAAERALATTAATTRQAILDELLTPLVPGGPAARRRMRRATLVGIDPTLAYHLLVVRPEGEAEVPGELMEDLGRRLARDPARRPAMVASRGGDVVAIAAPPWRAGAPFAELVSGLAPDIRWWASVGGPTSFDGLPALFAEVSDALRVVPGVADPGSIVALADVALERALVADPVQAAQGVERWLGPLERAGRSGPELIRTLETWLGNSQSVVATARVLSVAPRTVSYRIDRIAGLLGVRALDAGLIARLSTALLARRLLGVSASTDRDG